MGGFSENGTSSSEQALLFLTRNYLIPCLEVLPSTVIKREFLWDRHELCSDKASAGDSANSSHSLVRATLGHDFRTRQVGSLIPVLIEHPRVFYQASFYVTE